MANRPEPREKMETNGLAKDINLESTVREIEKYPALQGYILLGLGTVLTLFSLGFFPILRWALFAAGLGLALWGAARAHLIETVSNFFETLRKKF